MTLFYLPGQWLIMKEVKTEQLTEKLLICPLHLSPPNSPSHEHRLTFSICLWKLWFVLIGQGSERSSSLPCSTPWGPTVCENLLQKRKKKKRQRKSHPQTCSLPTGSDSWGSVLANLVGQEVEGWELGLGKDSPREATQTLMVSAGRKWKNRMTKSPVIRVVCLAKWANIEVHWQIRQEK